MPRISSLIAVVAGFLSIGAGAVDPPMPGEAKLTRALEDRVAGKPVKCILLRRVWSSRTIDRTAIIFDAGGTLYVNRPSSGAESLSESSALVTKTVTGEICRGEAAELFDTASRFQTGIVFFGEFVPYRKRSLGNSLPQGGGYLGSGY